MMDYAAIKAEARARGCRVEDLIALAPANDPFYVGRPADLEAARWLAALWRRLGYGHGVHLRRIHYQIVSQRPAVTKPNGTPYENSEADWQFLAGASKWARYLGLVPAEHFVDRRNPDPAIFGFWHADCEPDYAVTYGGDWEEHSLPDLPALPDLPEDLPDLPGFEARGYDQAQQGYLIEVWCEKSTMDDVLEPLCRQYGANFVTGAGELSITAALAFLQRARRAGRPARILYISDFDPAGLGMPISVARKIEFFQRARGFGELEVRLQPIVLTAEQVARFDLPRVPVKDSDRRKATFEANHGAGQVELDALEALYPGELARIVEEAILLYFDPGLRDAARGQEAALEGALDEERERIVAERQAEIEALEADYAGFLADYEETRRRFDLLVAAFEPELEAQRARLEGICERGRSLHGSLLRTMQYAETDAGDYPMPEPDLPEEPDGLLYDSQRGYFEQLEAYKAHRRGAGNGNDSDGGNAE